MDELKGDDDMRDDCIPDEISFSRVFASLFPGVEAAAAAAAVAVAESGVLEAESGAFDARQIRKKELMR